MSIKLLFLTPQLPYPPHQGTTIRNYHLIRHLAEAHTIDLLTFIAPDQTPDPSSPLFQACRRVAHLPQPVRSLRQRAIDTLRSPLPDMGLRLESRAMHELVQQWLQEGYDIVQIEGIEMAQYGLHALTVSPTSSKRPALVFDDHNCEYLLQQRNALTDLRRPQRWPAAFYSLIQWQKLRRYERHICHRANAVLAVSPIDQQALQRLAPRASITVIANGIETIPSPPHPLTPSPRSRLEGHRLTSKPHPPTLLFTGKMDYRPNIDAVLWFADEVLPLILQERPEVRFQIVGMNPHPRLDRLRQQPAIEITGAVESIEPYMQKAAVYVVPLRVGGGTRFKVLDAMVYAKPIVSTALGVEGIGVQHEGELLVADTPSIFAQAVLRLLQDTALGNRLGTTAHHFVNRHYSWQKIMPHLEAVYQRYRDAD